jgi:hypothetical protein
LKRLTAGLLVGLCVAVLAPATATAAKQDKVPDDFYGAVLQGTIGEYDTFLMQYAGLETMRFHFNWGIVQAEPGRCQATALTGICNWEALDTLIGLLAKYNVRSFPYILNVPPFIDPDPNVPPIRSKSDIRAYEGWLDAAVRRYGQGGIYWRKFFGDQYPGAKPRPITHWEVWNEPSDGSYWHPRPNAKEYAKLLKISGRAIHRANPKADVVFAGLFGTPTEDNNGIKAFKYYNQAFGVPGIGRYFDDIGVHPSGPTLKRLQTQMDWVREEAKEAGFDDRDIWVTEIAWSSSEPPVILGVGPEGQAALLKKGFGLFEDNAKAWNIAGVHWYAWQDLPAPGLCEFCYESGLLTYSRDPKPSYYAFSDVAGGKARRGAPLPRP